MPYNIDIQHHIRFKSKKNHFKLIQNCIINVWLMNSDMLHKDAYLKPHPPPLIF